MTRTTVSRSTPTISQVASAAGVSRSSVSRAFSRPELLGKETVERIMAVARDIGYVPNHTARALSTGRYSNIALVVPDVANPFFPPIIEGAQAEADQSDFCVFLGNSGESPRHEDALLDRFMGQVEGVVLVSSRLSEARIRHHAARKPIVLVNRDVKGLARVLIDSSQGVEQAVAHLNELGHRRIAYVAGPAQSWSNRQRRATVVRVSKRLGLAVTVIPTPVPSYAAGVAAAKQIIKSSVTAAVAFDDLTAQGVMAGLAEQGLTVPSDMSVIGCDDVLGASTYPAMTSVSSRSAEAGKAAVSLLLDFLSGSSLGDARLALDTHLVMRQTTQAPAT